jgi:serine protease Do
MRKSFLQSAFLRAVLILFLVSAAAPAQDPTVREVQSPEERERLYQEIAEEVTLLERQGRIIKNVVRLTGPTVVHIEAKKTNAPEVRFGTRRPVEEAGSGVIVKINDKFYAITNRHVINYAPIDEITVILDDERRVNPKDAWADKGTDVAVLELDVDKLVPAKLGDSNKVEIGDFVIAIGSPFGLSHSVTYGIISAKGRRDLKLGSADQVRYQDFMQTDAAINPGNSGGPLLNLRGEVIGINTAIASNSGGNEGIGFSIPINMAKVVAKQLVTKGNVTRAFLGVNLDPQFNTKTAQRLGMSRPQGARVTGVTPKSAAAVAKLQVDDILFIFNGIDVDDDNHLVNLVSLTPVDTEIDVVIFRDGKQVTVPVTVTDRSVFEARR